MERGAYLPGVPAAQASSFDPEGAAAAVGRFLGALRVPAPADAQANPFRGVPLAERAGNFAANVALLAGKAARIKPNGTRCSASGSWGQPACRGVPAGVVMRDGYRRVCVPGARRGSRCPGRCGGRASGRGR